MVFPIEKLFAEVGMDESDAKTLGDLCRDAGLEEAVDPAFLSYDEAVEVTGGDSRLAGLLMEAGRKARPLVENWANCGVRAGRGGGGGPPGGPELVQGPRLSDLPPPG